MFSITTLKNYHIFTEYTGMYLPHLLKFISSVNPTFTGIYIDIYVTFTWDFQTGKLDVYLILCFSIGGRSIVYWRE